MMDDFARNITDMQKDALKEVGNIGAGNAATAFAEFLNSQINMSVPAVEIKPVSIVPEITGNIEENMIGVLLRVQGDIPGNILFILTENSVKYLLEIILNYEVDVDNLNEMEISAIKEMGNILSGSYLKALCELTGLELNQSFPGYAHDMVGAILSSTMVEMDEPADYALLIETIFSDGTNEIEGYFLFIPEPASLKKLLSVLGFDV